ncbi:hypothetical protein GYMLUDRAFT_876588 [Collybiopsis luxurians FD-317 M1]|nr:hypothetical protein GYMLUDRAFT_876588 [Collybiopsis luxurians FD-317 M1]
MILFDQLPDDILFNIFNLLPPLDLIALRKTCQQFRLFTSKRTLWAAACRNSQLFLPSGLYSNQSVSDLERILIRAHRLDSTWPHLHNDDFFGRPSESFKSEINEVRQLDVYRGRILVIAGPSGCLLYDIETKAELFRYKEQLYNFSKRSGILDNEADIYIPFARRGHDNGSLNPVIICKIDPLNNITVMDLESVPIRISDSHKINIGYNFLLARQESDGSLALLHIPSQVLYSLSTEMTRMPENVVFTPGRVFMFFVERIGRDIHQYVEVFPFPDTSVVVGGTRVPRTHCGTLPLHLMEPGFVSSLISEIDHCGSIWFIALFDRGARPMRLTLLPDASLSHYIPDQYSNPHYHSGWSHPYGLVLEAIPGSRARGISRTDGFDSVLYDVHLDPNGELVINTAFLMIPQLVYAKTYTLDASRGLLIVARNPGEIDVFDLA